MPTRKGPTPEQNVGAQENFMRAMIGFMAYSMVAYERHTPQTFRQAITEAEQVMHDILDRVAKLPGIQRDGTQLITKGVVDWVAALREGRIPKKKKLN